MKNFLSIFNKFSEKLSNIFNFEYDIHPAEDCGIILIDRSLLDGDDMFHYIEHVHKVDVIDIDKYKYIHSLSGRLNSKIPSSLFPQNLIDLLKQYSRKTICLIFDTNDINEEWLHNIILNMNGSILLNKNTIPISLLVFIKYISNPVKSSVYDITPEEVTDYIDECMNENESLWIG